MCFARWCISNSAAMFDKHTPIVRKREIKRRLVPLLTQDILNQMAWRDAVNQIAKKTGDAEDIAQYCQLRNRVKKSLRNSRLW